MIVFKLLFCHKDRKYIVNYKTLYSKLNDNNE